jgi:uncharacterized membrane protein
LPVAIPFTVRCLLFTVHHSPFPPYLYFMSFARPKITIEKTSNEKMLEILSFGTVAGMWLMTLLRYPALPERIPIHFDGSGTINGWGSKSAIFLLPVIATVIASLIHYIRKHPEWHNYAVKLTPENAQELYTGTSRALSWINYIIILLFAVIQMSLLDAARNHTTPNYFPLVWVLFAALVILPFIQVIRFLRKK